MSATASIAPSSGLVSISIGDLIDAQIGVQIKEIIFATCLSVDAQSEIASPLDLQEYMYLVGDLGAELPDFGDLELKLMSALKIDRLVTDYERQCLTNDAPWRATVTVGMVIKRVKKLYRRHHQ